MKVGRGETNHVYVDVDGTLLIWPTRPGAPQPGETPRVNSALVDCLKSWQRSSGGRIVVWTMGGCAHAEMAADLCGLESVTCIAKPDLVIDDGPEFFKRKLPVQSPEEFCRGATW